MQARGRQACLLRKGGQQPLRRCCTPGIGAQALPCCASGSIEQKNNIYANAKHGPRPTTANPVLVITNTTHMQVNNGIMEEPTVASAILAMMRPVTTPRPVNEFAVRSLKREKLGG